MTPEEFDEKYKDFLEEGHYGLALDNEEAIDYLDEKFQEFIKIPEFSFTQIKGKYHWFCFYCKGLDNHIVREVENKLFEIYNKQ